MRTSIVERKCECEQGTVIKIINKTKSWGHSSTFCRSTVGKGHPGSATFTPFLFRISDRKSVIDYGRTGTKVALYHTTQPRSGISSCRISLHPMWTKKYAGRKFCFHPIYWSLWPAYLGYTALGCNPNIAKSRKKSIFVQLDEPSEMVRQELQYLRSNLTTKLKSWNWVAMNAF